MPSTLPGFLAVAGTLMFVASLFTGPLKFWIFEIERISLKARKILKILGIAFMLSGFSMYGYFIFVDEQPPMLHIVEDPADGTVDDCSQKAVRVHGPGNSARTIYACDGQGVADELDKNCSDSVVDLCDVTPSDTESCEWDRVSSNLTDTQFDWVSDEETEMEMRYVKVEHWGCTSN